MTTLIQPSGGKGSPYLYVNFDLNLNINIE